MKQALVVVLLMLLALVADCQQTTGEEQYEKLKVDFINDVVLELDTLSKNGTKYSEEKANKLLLMVIANRTRSCFLVDENVMGRLLYEVISSDKVQKAYKALKIGEISTKALSPVPVIERKKILSEEEYQLLKSNLINDVASELKDLAKRGYKYNEEKAHEKLRDILMMVTANRTQFLRPVVDENQIDNLMNEVPSSDKVQKAYKMIISNEIASRSVGAVPDKSCGKNSTEEQYQLLKANFINDVLGELKNLAKTGSKYNVDGALEELRDILMMMTANSTEPRRPVVNENQIGRLVKEVLTSDKVQKAYEAILRYQITSRASGAVPVRERQKHYQLLKANLINDVTVELNNLAKTGKKYDEEGAHMKLRDILMMVTANRTRSLKLIVDENKLGRLVNEVINSDKVEKAYKGTIRDEIAQRALDSVLERGSEIKSKEEEYELLKDVLINDVAGELFNLAKKRHKYNEEGAHEQLRDILMMATANRAESLRPVVDENKFGRLMNDVIRSEKVQQAYKAIMRDEIVSIVRSVDSVRKDIDTSCKDKYELFKTELIKDVTARLYDLSKSGTKYTMDEGREKLRDIFMMVFANRTQSLTSIVDENKIARLMNDVFRSDKVQQAFKAILK